MAVATPVYQNDIDISACGAISRRIQEQIPSYEEPKEGPMTTGIFLSDLEFPNVLREIVGRGGRSNSKLNQEIRLRELLLSYHFGGLEVVCKNTEKGVVIIASGPVGEVGEHLRTLKGVESQGLTVLFPKLWEQALSEVSTKAAGRSR